MEVAAEGSRRGALAAIAGNQERRLSCGRDRSRSNGRVELLDRDKRVLLAREFAMEVEEGRWNSEWLKLGTVEDVSSIASLALAVYSINED